MIKAMFVYLSLSYTNVACFKHSLYSNIQLYIHCALNVLLLIHSMIYTYFLQVFRSTHTHRNV